LILDDLESQLETVAINYHKTSLGAYSSRYVKNCDLFTLISADSRLLHTSAFFLVLLNVFVFVWRIIWLLILILHTC